MKMRPLVVELITAAGTGVSAPKSRLRPCRTSCKSGAHLCREVDLVDQQRNQIKM